MKQRVGRRVSGQSTLEYILVIAAVLIAVVAVTVAALRPAVGKMSNEAANTISAASEKVKTGLGL